MYYSLSIIFALCFIPAWIYREKYMFYDLIFGLLSVYFFQKAKKYNEK
jgi:hypothetical protein